MENELLIEENSPTVTYTVHHNWEWVVQASLKSILSRDANALQVNRSMLLPSMNGSKQRLGYALFRVESSDGKSAWASSLAFAFLDAKDSLYRSLLSVGSSDVMPHTKLVDWDVTEETSLGEFPQYPALLKAACGAGGFGLYFVYSPADVIHVIKKHASKAFEEENFLERLKSDHKGTIPQWSLQSLVRSVVLYEKYRCQLRVYAIICNSSCFMYTQIEVRIPSWGDDSIDSLVSNGAHRDSNNNSFSESNRASEETEQTEAAIRTQSLVDQFENDCCSGSHARPYNRGRVKTETTRKLLEEVPEIVHMKDAIHSCIRRAMTALQPVIAAELAATHSAAANVPVPPTASFVKSEVAIAGIDLMLETQPAPSTVTSLSSPPMYIPRIVELNNNPAMPGENKNMSDAYRNHLIEFVGSVIQLGLNEGKKCESFHFEQLW